MYTAQFISMGVIVCAVAVEIWWVATHKSQWLIAVPNIVWLTHSLLFYLCLWYHSPYDMAVYQDWSIILRLQGFLTMLMMGLYRMNGRFTKWIQ